VIHSRGKITRAGACRSDWDKTTPPPSAHFSINREENPGRRDIGLSYLQSEKKKKGLLEGGTAKEKRRLWGRWGDEKT